MDEDKCPICGSKGVTRFISFDCSNSHCENFDPSQAPEKTPDETPEDDWLLGSGQYWGVPF